MIKNYFKTAIRNLFRNKIYAFINIAGLSMGLACTMLIMLYVKDEVSYDRFHKNGDQICHVVRKAINPDGSTLASDGYTGVLQGPRFTSSIPEIKGFVRLQNGYINIKKGSEIQLQEVLSVDSNFLSVFSFPLLKGNMQTALLQPNSVVISEDLAKKQFGTSDALNKIILLKNTDSFEPYIVTGVSKKCPQNSSIKFDALLPLKISKEDEYKSEAWLNVFLNTFVVLKSNVDVKSVEAKMKNVYETEAKEAISNAQKKYNLKWSAQYLLQPVTDMHLSKDYPPMDGLTDASDPVYSYILSGIALFILVIACINFINLTVARSLKRAKEIGIRKVIGGNRKQLIIQFLGESFLLCLTAFVLAILIVQLILPVFNQISNKILSLSYLSDVKLVTGYIILFFITGFLAGFYPALVLSNYDPVKTLYNRFSFGGKNYLQKHLVILQFTLASFFIIATFIITSQLNYLTNKPLGYEDSNLIVINQFGLKPAEAQLFSQSLKQNSNIIGVSAKNQGYYNTSAKVNGETEVPTVIETIDENYIPLLKVPIINGRNFSKDFTSDSSQSILVNETFAKQAGWKDPIGQQVNLSVEDARKFTIIGVVKDYNYQPLKEKIKAQVFSLTQGRGIGSLYIRIKSNSEASTLPFIEKTFKNIFPLSSYFYIFKSEENKIYYAAETKWKQMMLLSAIITIFISCIGLFGLSVLSAEKRTKEIGIRKVLGAAVISVVTILSKDFLKLVFISLVISMPLAWIATNKWLQNYPYRITLSWWLFASAGILVILIALITVSFQAIKAAISNPVKSLRTE